jgi:hypothetical protein
MASTRTSFAAFLADGRGSVLGSASGFYPPGTGSGGGGRPYSGRASVMSASPSGVRRGTGAPRAAPPPPQQLSAEQLAAAAARRERAAQQRALARMPGLLGKLEAVEKAVLLNVRHATLAQYHAVQPCRVEPCLPAHGVCPASEAPSDATAAEQGTAAPDTERQGREAGSALPSARECAVAGSPSSSATDAALPTEASLLVANSSSAPSIEGSSAAGTPPSLESQSVQQGGAELPLLWEWRSELSGGLPVSCLAWSPAAPHLLAVGYGQLQYAVSGTGLLAVWSLSRPGHPVWHAATPCGVSALDWSAKAPGTLAVGFFDGGVALYDVRSGAEAGRAAQPLARSPPAGAGGMRGGHGEPVWCVRYAPRPNDPMEEMLVTAASDGRVLEWKHAQGLERTELLQLKRQQSSSASRLGHPGSQVG